jgi:hypothetical protein
LVAVGSGQNTGFIYQHDGSDFWDELVVDQDAQILPAYFVTVRKTSLSDPDVTYNDARFLSYKSTFESSMSQMDELMGLIPMLGDENQTILDSENSDFEMVDLKSNPSNLFSDSSEIL